MKVSQAYIAYMNNLLLTYKPKEFYFKNWMYNLVPDGGEKPGTVNIQVLKNGESAQYNDTLGYNGSEMEATYEEVKYDIDLSLRQTVDKKQIRDIKAMQSKFNSICLTAANENDAYALNKLICTKLFNGAGTKVNVANANVNALGVMKAIKKGINDLYNVKATDVNDWSLTTQDFSVVIPYRVSALILEAYETKTVYEIQGSVTVENGIITKLYGADCIVLADEFAETHFDWEDISGKKFLRKQLDSNPVIFALVAKNKPDKPVFVIDKQFVDTGNGEDTNKSAYYFNYRTVYAMKVLPSRKKGVYVAIQSDTEPVSVYSVQEEVQVETKSVSGALGTK